MEILYVLIPVSVVLVLAVIAVLGWAVNSGQFEDVEQEGVRILQPEGRQDRGNVELFQE